jgi:ferredoxin-NADP reductase
MAVSLIHQYLCGPTAFVGRAADLLVQLGHEPGRIRVEDFGPMRGSVHQ